MDGIILSRENMTKELKGGTILMGFNNKLYELRRQKGFSQEELASRLNVSRQTISKWERGYSIPDAEMLTRLACALDVSVDELLGTTAESPEEKARLANELAQINEKLAQKDRQ